MSIYQQIRDAWANVDPLSKVLPFDDDEFLDGEPFEDDVAAYLALAANHADKMADRIIELEDALHEADRLLSLCEFSEPADIAAVQRIEELCP